MANLPYVTATGNVDKALTAIKAAATPERVSQDFVKTILKIPGGSGDQMLSFLKKIGFTNADGTPSDLYKMFRNNSTSGKAAASALRFGYGPLYKRNEYMHSLADDKLRGLIVEETGQSADSTVITMVLNCIKGIKKFTATEDFSASKTGEAVLTPIVEKITQNSDKDPPTTTPPPSNLGLNLSYTINLNLPATSDVSVFNAIFKSLKENLLKADND